MNVRLEVVILSQKQHIRLLKKIDFENIDKENNSTKILVCLQGLQIRLQISLYQNVK